MKNRVTGRLAAVAVALLLAAGTARAAVQVTKAVGWLGEGDWQLRDDGEEAYFAKAPYEAGADVRHTSWSVSSPTIKSLFGNPQVGNLLAYDATGKGPKPRMVFRAGKGDSTRWAFETVSHIAPGRSKTPDAGHLKVGAEGITFRAMATEGPYKGWYLATKHDGEGRRTLVLVREKKKATEFKYIAKYYSVDP